LKIVGTIALSIFVLVAAIVFLLASSCALGGNSMGGNRVLYAVVALLDLFAIVIAVSLIAKLNRKKLRGSKA